MTIRVVINGFGRMGRLGFRAGFGREDFEIVHVNDSQGDAPGAAHLLKYDSVHGRWDADIACRDTAFFSVNGKNVGFTSFASIEELPWKDLDADIALDCTGKFKTVEKLGPYLVAGVRKVVVSTPVKDKTVLNTVMGVNDSLYDPNEHSIVTAASCTTNALAPVVKVVNEGLGIKHGVITTIHDVTNTQTIVDKFHKDLRRARSSSLSLIPTSTGSAKAIGGIFPELDGKLNSVAIRVPMQNSSIIDCVFEVNRTTTVEEVNGLFENAANGPLKGTLGYETLPLVSADYLNESRASVIDALSTMVVNGTQVKVIAWYDNEWGYVSQMMKLVGKVARGLG